MAASSSADARGSPAAERYRLLRKLGAREVSTFAALDSQSDKPHIVVVERVARRTAQGDQEIADWVRDAKRLATLEHPNVGRVRDVAIRGEDVLVVTDYVDGVLWSELGAIAPRPSLEIALRILVDVLSGLSAVHNLRDAKREPLKLVHGDLGPDCIVVGLDGVARLVSTCRVHSAASQRSESKNAYLAPEVLLADESTGSSADVYSVGVILWEALTGRQLFPNTQPSAIVTQVLSGKVQRPSPQENAAWTAPLGDVAMRALSADPEKRFASAAAFAAELRRIAGPKLAPPVRVAALVRGTFGDRIRTRREALERGEASLRETEISGVGPQPSSVDIRISEPPIPSTAPTPLPQSPDGTTATPDIPPEAIKPPPVPKFRAPQVTQLGVAPPATENPPPLAPARVMVPTPFLSFEVPARARGSEASAPASSEVVASPEAEPPPAPPVVPNEPAAHDVAPPVAPQLPVVAVMVPPGPRRTWRRGRTLGIAAAISIIGGATAWWALSPHSASTRAVASIPTAHAAGALVGNAAASATPARVPTETASGATVATAAMSAPLPSQAPTLVPASPGTLPPSRATGPSARPSDKKRYDPEGI